MSNLIPLQLHCNELPTAEKISALRASLHTYNETQVGPITRREVLFYYADQAGQMKAGIYGWLRFGWLYIDLLWVDTSYRGQDLGSRLLEAIESYATQHGVFRANLHTGSFQAPAFYQKRGYEVFAQLPCTADDPDSSFPEFIDYQLKKDLRVETKS